MKQFRISVDNESGIQNSFGGSSNFYPPTLDPEQHTNNRRKHHNDDVSGRYHQQPVVHAPVTPRNIQNPGRAQSQGIHYPFLSASHNGSGMREAQPRSFFPDSGPRSCRYMMQKKAQNVDRDLAEAVQQVVTLSLEGPAHHKISTATNTDKKAPEVCAFSRYESSPSPMFSRKEWKPRMGSYMNKHAYINIYSCKDTMPY